MITPLIVVIPVTMQAYHIIDYIPIHLFYHPNYSLCGYEMNLIVALICISQITYSIEHFFMGWLDCVSLKKCLFRFLPNFKMGYQWNHLIHFELIFCMVWCMDPTSLFCMTYPVLPASFLEKSILSPMNYLYWHSCLKIDHSYIKAEF